MSKADVKRSPTKVGGGKNPDKLGWLMALQLLDTTWRVALPIILLTFIGAKLDKHYNTSPAFILTGLFLSLFIAIILVYRQIKVAYPDFFGGKKK